MQLGSLNARKEQWKANASATNCSLGSLLSGALEASCAMHAQTLPSGALVANWIVQQSVRTVVISQAIVQLMRTVLPTA